MRCRECGDKLGATAKFCPECGTPVAAAEREREREAATVAARPTPTIRLPTVPGDAERRQVTVMFCDLVGSTELSVALDPEDTRAVVRGYQEVASREVVRFGGHVAQYTGDGILAYFGYPTAYEDAASRAVGAALAILEGMARLRIEAHRQQRPEVHVRIGIHTGLVVVGEMGSGARTERLAVGDTPNIAARIQSLAEPNVALMSDVTAGLVSKRFHTELIGERTIKGVREPVLIHRAVQAHGVLDESNRGSATPLVNRSAERGRLLRAWANARAGQGGAVLVSGDGGIGKSRVLQFAKEHVDTAAGETRLELRCQSMHKESAFYPFVEHLYAECGFAASDDALARLDKLARTLEARAPELQDDLPVFAALLLLPPPPNAEAVDPMALRGRIESALERWVLAHARGPLLFVVEDLHWADASTLDVLERVILASSHQPVLVALAFRSEFSVPPTWPAAGVVDHVELQRLQPHHVREIVGNVSAGSDLPSDVVDELLARIDGVPIYAEELTKSILSSGATREGEFVIPSTLQDSLLARLDRLGPIRAIAQMGAVIGRQFDYQTLLALSGADEVSLQRALVKLTDSDVLIQSGALPSARFSFRHALLHEATYGALLRDRRHAMHAEVGRILEGSARNAVIDDLTDDERVKRLSYHWHRAVPSKQAKADVVEKAITYAIRAGEQQLAVSGYREAEAHFKRALEHLPSLPAGRRRDELELQARVRLATAYKASVGPAAEQVREELSRCRELCLELGNRPELGAVLYGFWQLHLFRAEYPIALAVAEECHAEALRSADEDLLIQSYVALANTQFWFGDLDASLANALEALATYDKAKHQRHAVSFGMDPGVLALMFASWVPQLRGQSDVARARHDELLRLSAELDHPLSKALALNTSCCYYVNEGDVEGARAAGEALLALAQTHGLPVYAMFGVLFRGWAIAEQGKVAEVLDEVRQTYQNYVTYVGGLAQTFAAILVCGVYARAGRLDDALEVVNNVMAVAGSERCREQVYEVELLRLKAELLASRNDADVDTIDGMLRQAVELAQSRGEHLLALRSATALCTFLDRRGESTAEGAVLVDSCRRAIDAIPAAG